MTRELLADLEDFSPAVALHFEPSEQAAFAKGLDVLRKLVSEPEPPGGEHPEPSAFPMPLPNFICQAGGPVAWAAAVANYLLGREPGPMSR